MGGCGKTTISQDLTQNQANEIVTVLNEQGISAVAERDAGGRGYYRVKIQDDRYSEAISLLHRKGLPREQNPLLKELLASHGIVPSSREIEQLKLDYAIATQFEDMLLAYPGVSGARVIVRLNAVREGEEASVSGVVQAKPGVSVSAEIIRELAGQVVPGVKPEHVSIVVGEVADQPGKKRVSVGVSDEGEYLLQVPLVPFLYFWRVPQSEYTGLAFTMLGVLFLVGAIGIGAGFWSGFYRHAQRPMESELPMVMNKSNKSDGGVGREPVAREFREMP